MEGMLVRTTTPGICNKRLFKGKCVDQIQVLKENLLVGRASNHNSGNIIVNGLNNAKPKSYEPSIRGQTRAQAILTPVSDPTPTAQKVRELFLAHGGVLCSPLVAYIGFEVGPRLAQSTTCLTSGSAIQK